MLKKIIYIFIFLAATSIAYSNPCAFCDKSVLESQVFYEGDLALALYTHKPIFPGHCLIIPKRHVERFEMLSAAELAEMMDLVKKVHVAATRVFGTSPYLLLQKNGREAGQSVPHVHFHYIPRKIGDDSALKFVFRMFIAYRAQKPIKPEEMQEIVEKMKEAMAY